VQSVELKIDLEYLAKTYGIEILDSATVEREANERKHVLTLIGTKR
jgi:hypothetical protein